MAAILGVGRGRERRAGHDVVMGEEDKVPGRRDNVRFFFILISFFTSIIFLPGYNPCFHDIFLTKCFLSLVFFDKIS
jgi:hypothetical protein